MGLIQTFDQLRFSYIAIIEGGHRLLQNRFTQEELASGHDLVDDDEDEDEDMEEDDDDDDSDQSDSEEEDEASGFLVSANQREEDDEPEDLPDIAPPPPPKRVESLSPASERKYLLQAAAVAAEAGRPADGSDDEEMTPPLPPLPKKHNMGLNMNKMARPGSTDTLSIDEGFVDLNTPGTEGDPTNTLVGNSNMRKRVTTTTGQSSFDSTPEETLPSPSRNPAETKDQHLQQRLTDEKSWKWLLLPLPVLFLGYFVYKCYYS